MENLVVRSQEELASAIEAIVKGISIGLRNTRDDGVIVRNPDQIEITGVFLIESNVDTVEASDTQPAVTRTSTKTTPATTVTRETEEGEQTTTETQTPPSSTSEQSQGGGDTTKTTRKHKEF